MEQVLRKLDRTTITFAKAEDQRFKMFGNDIATDDQTASRTVMPDQVFEVRYQDGQLALALKQKGSPVGSEAGQECLSILAAADILGGWHTQIETLPEYLTRIISTLTSSVTYGAKDAITEKPLRSALRQTHTYVTMEVSASTYYEISAKMRGAGYDDAFGEDGEIDMHGIAVTQAEPVASLCPNCGVDVLRSNHALGCRVVAPAGTQFIGVGGLGQTGAAQAFNQGAAPPFDPGVVMRFEVGAAPKPFLPGYDQHTSLSDAQREADAGDPDISAGRLDHGLELRNPPADAVKEAVAGSDGLGTGHHASGLSNAYDQDEGA